MKYLFTWLLVEPSAPPKTSTFSNKGNNGKQDDGTNRKDDSTHINFMWRSDGGDDGDDDDDDDDGDGGNDDDDDGTPQQSWWEGHRRVQLLVSQAPPFDTWSLP